MTITRSAYYPFHLAATALTTIALTAGSCNRQPADTPVPRPTAFHRIELPDSSFTPLTAAGITFDVNSHCIITQDNVDGWLTATYPSVGASIYLTVTKLTPATAADAIDNRIERLSLNTGGAPTRVTSFTTPTQLDARLIITSHGTPTPVQFIATDHRLVMVSGSVELPGAATAPADSLAPVLELLDRDITHLLQSITPQ